jgi:hypothetical protein
MTMGEVKITATKAAYWVPVSLDTDGTPLTHGERMIETGPGVWKSPDLVAVEEFIQSHPAEDLTEEDLIAGAVLITEASMAERRADDG